MTPIICVGRVRHVVGLGRYYWQAKRAANDWLHVGDFGLSPTFAEAWRAGREALERLQAEKGTHVTDRTD